MSVFVAGVQDNLQNALTAVVRLKSQNESLPPIFGDDFSKIADYTKEAENLKNRIQKKGRRLMNLAVLIDSLQPFLKITRELLSVLSKKLDKIEASIEILLPTNNYLWEKNYTLSERIKHTMEIMSNGSISGLKQLMENLSKALYYIDECVETIGVYNDKQELLLNYPIAEIAIEDLLRKKDSISTQDLPFEPKYSAEFLRLFYSKKYFEFTFDKPNMLLLRRT